MAKLFQRIGVAGIVLAPLVGFSVGAAQAAPQVLALVETEGKVGLTCSGRECSVELTSFCLDASRFAPLKGTEYSLAATDMVQLTGTTKDGRALTLDPNTFARFISQRRHLAVRVSVEKASLQSLNLERIEVEVAANAALIPVPEPNDPTAISDSEADLLSGPLRKLGSEIVDRNPVRMQAARITSRIINLLPANGRGSSDGVESLWQRATKSDGTNGVTSTASGRISKSITHEARQRARGALELCQYVASVGGSTSFRRCLQEKHDSFVDFLNSKYWKAVNTGT